MTNKDIYALNLESISESILLLVYFQAGRKFSLQRSCISCLYMYVDDYLGFSNVNKIGTEKPLNKRFNCGFPYIDFCI